jgi:hypothetical protein
MDLTQVLLTVVSSVVILLSPQSTFSQETPSTEPVQKDVVIQPVTEVIDKQNQERMTQTRPSQQKQDKELEMQKRQERQREQEEKRKAVYERMRQQQQEKQLEKKRIEEKKVEEKKIDTKEMLSPTAFEQQVKNELKQSASEVSPTVITEQKQAIIEKMKEEVREEIKKNEQRKEEILQSKQEQAVIKQEFASLKQISQVVEERKEEVRAQAQEQRQEFTANVAKIADVKKREAVIRVDGIVNSINTQQTASLTQSVNKLSDVLKQFEAKIASAKTAGKNTAVAEATLVYAQEKVVVAHAAVANQAAKSYTAQVEETNLKPKIDELRLQLVADMKATSATVLQAKHAVFNVATELSKL